MAADPGIDAWGDVTIPLDESLCTPGTLSIDSDANEDGGLVLIVRLEFSSDNVSSYGDAEIDFGTFQVTLPDSRMGILRAGFMLNEDQTRFLAKTLGRFLDESESGD